MTITVIGTGFVGVVTSVVYASFGHRVYGLDIDEQKIDSLKQNKLPFYEPQLDDLLKQTQKKGQLKFTTSYQEAVGASDLIVIAVGTPSSPEGGVDLRYVESAVQAAAKHLKPNAIIAIKSTIPPGSFSKIKPLIDATASGPYQLAALPEFLREGSAVHDTLHPDRVVIGAHTDEVFHILEQLHAPLEAPVIKITPESAQLAKYAANSYLALRITFVNQLADLCDKNGADIEQVIQAISPDQRIGGHYWYPGPGYGGSCFPKDVKELAHFSKQVGESENLFVKVDELNDQRPRRLFEQWQELVDGWQGKKVAVLGLAFKPDTNDLREAASTKFIPWLVKAGASVKAWDPVANPLASRHFDQLIKAKQLTLTNSLFEAARSADVILVLTEWPEIISFDYSKVRGQNKQAIIDTRNRLDRYQTRKLGFEYVAIGRRA